MTEIWERCEKCREPRVGIYPEICPDCIKIMIKNDKEK